METKNELMNIKVVQHNNLVTSIARMDRVPLKFFEFAVSALDTENPPEDRTVHLRKGMLYKYFDNTGANKHNNLRSTLDTLHKAVTFYMERELENGSIDSQLISGIAKTNWNSASDKVSVTFTSEIMPYLIVFKKNFTQYLIADISKLNSKYSIIIYKLLNMNYGQYEYYQNRFTRTASQLEEWKNPEISLEELKKITDTQKQYKQIANFEKRVIKSAVDEINENTNFDVTYKKIRYGRSIGAFKFFINKKEVAENSYYKDEQEDPVYLEGKNLTEKEKETFYKKAMTNPYTQMFLKLQTDMNGLNANKDSNGQPTPTPLITFQDLIDKETMIAMERTVYPLYEILAKQVKRTGEPIEHRGVIKHLTYIQAHKLDYSIENKPLYLRKAVIGYLKNEFNVTVDL